MEFDPLAPESLRQSGQADDTKPSLGEKAKSNIGKFAMQAGTILGFAGSIVAFDQANAQGIAVNTPQWKPPIAGPAIPGNPETTTEEAPTAEAVIGILQNGRELIKKKFRTYNDATFQQIVGQISLGTIKSETLVALAGAFAEGSPEQKAVLSFGMVVSTPKPQADLASPSGNKESKEEQKLKKEREAILKVINKNLWEPKEWGIPEAKPNIRVSKKDGGIIFTHEVKNKKMNPPIGAAGLVTALPPGEYYIELSDATTKFTLWLYGDAIGRPVKKDGSPGVEGTEICAPQLNDGEKHVFPIKIPIYIPKTSMVQTLTASVSPLNPIMELKKNTVKIEAKRD